MNTNIYRFLFLLDIYIYVYIHILSKNIRIYIISVAFSNTICGSSNFTCSNQSMYAYIYLFCYKLFISLKALKNVFYLSVRCK